jgi:hypothetical protein
MDLLDVFPSRPDSPTDRGNHPGTPTVAAERNPGVVGPFREDILPVIYK